MKIKDDVFNVRVKWANGVTADCWCVESWLNLPTLSQKVLCVTAISGELLISVEVQIMWRVKSNVIAKRV